MNEKAIYSILFCVDKADGLISRGTLAKLLIGQNSRAIKKYGLDHITEFGSLAGMSKADILNHIDYLIERGCIEVGFWTFPNIHITDQGRDRLRRMSRQGLTAELEKEITTEKEKAIRVCNELEFWELFLTDLEKARSSVVIISAFVSDYRINILIPYLEKIIKRKVRVKIYIRPLIRERRAIRRLKDIGIDIVYRKRIHQKLAVIDNSIAWTGSLNILQHTNSKELMIRHTDYEHIQELMELIRDL